MIIDDIRTQLKNTLNIVEDLYARADQLVLKETRLNKKLEIINQKEGVLDRRYNAVQNIESDTIVKQNKVVKESKTLNEKKEDIEKAQKKLDIKKEEIAELLTILDKKELTVSKINTREEELIKNEGALKSREVDVEAKEVGVKKETEINRKRQESLEELELNLNKDRAKIKRILSVA